MIHEINKFAIVCFPEENIKYVSILHEKFNNFNAKLLKLEDVVIYIIFNNDQSIYEYENKLFLIDGVFFVRSSLIVDENLNDFLNNFDHQGIFVILDKTKKTINAIRDPFGSRNLFYSQFGSIQIISNDFSLIINILRELNYKFNIDIVAIYEFLVLETIKSRRTLIKEIKQIYPGEYIEIFLPDRSLMIKRYYEPWKMELKKAISLHLISEVFKFLKKRFNDICYLTMCSNTGNRKIAVPISGGLDTTFILALMLENDACKELTFPIHINIIKEHELKLTKEVSKKFNLQLHYEVYHYRDIISIYRRMLGKLLREFGYPRKGDAALPYLFIGKCCSKYGIKLSVSGDGGDGLFGGYDSYGYLIIDLLKKYQLKELIILVKVLLLRGKLSIFQIAKTTFKSFILNFYPIKFFILKRKISKILNKNMKNLIRNISNYLLYYDTFLDRYVPSPSNYKKFLLEYATFELPDILNIDVKAHELCGVSVVFPFVSRKFFEILFILQDYLFFLPYGSRSLQRIFLKYLGFSKEIYLQGKSGFSVTSLILQDDTLVDSIKAELKKCWLSRYINVNKLKGLRLLNAYNVHVHLKSLNIESI